MTHEGCEECGSSAWGWVLCPDGKWHRLCQACADELECNGDEWK